MSRCTCEYGAQDFPKSKVCTVRPLQRKETLLIEYRQLRKANVFVDQRFGEDDDALTAEDRAVARFQKQRMKDTAGKCKYQSEWSLQCSAYTVQ